MMTLRIIRCDHIAKPGRFSCECQSHPLAGTQMLGEMSGGEESEWSERTALVDLQDVVIWSGRPAGMSDRQWRRTLAITRVKPITEADIAAMLADDEAVD